MLKLLKDHPQLLIDFLSKAEPEEKKAFAESLPLLYFDYTSTHHFAGFLKCFFAHKAESGMIDYVRDSVSSVFPNIWYILTL